MSNAIPPALTAEEWVTKRRAGSDPGFLPMRSAWLHEYADADGVWNSLSLAGLAGAVTVNRPDMHAIAALCLHEQPGGFTQAHVDALLKAIRSDALTIGTSFALCEVLDRIEALLPPSDKPALAPSVK